MTWSGIATILSDLIDDTTNPNADDNPTTR